MIEQEATDKNDKNMNLMTTSTLAVHAKFELFQVHITILLFKNALARVRVNIRGQRIWLRLVVINLFQARKKLCVHVFWWFYKPVFLTVGRHFLSFLWLRYSLVVFILTGKLWSLEHKIRLIWVLHEPWPTCPTLKCILMGGNLENPFFFDCPCTFSQRANTFTSLKAGAS